MSDDRNLPVLIWPNGRPMVRTELKKEVAGPTTTGVRQIWSGHPAQNLTPSRLTALLRAAEEGDATTYLELAEEMEEKDLHYLAVLKKRKEAIAQLPIEVIPADDSAEAKSDAELLEEWIDRDELQDELFDILDAIGKGWSATEIIWATDGGTWLPERLEWRDPRWFEWDRNSGRELLLKGEDGIPMPLGAAKFIVHRAQAKSGLPVRGGLARAAAWHYLFKNMAWKDWVSFLETFGMPLRLGRYDNGETEENKRILLSALAMLGSDAAAMYPKTMDVEFVDPKAGTAPGDLWKALIDTCDEYLSKVVLGQTNTTDAKSGGLGSGQANVHREVEETIERSDARRLSTSLNRDLVRPMIMLNHGERRKYPKIRIGRPDPVDVEAMGKAAQIFVPMGMKVSMKKMREASGLPAPEGDEEVLRSPSAGAPADDDPKRLPAPAAGAPDLRLVSGRGDRNGGKLPRNGEAALLEASLHAKSGGSGDADDADRDVIDAAAEEALSDWEELLDPVIAPIEEMLAGATSLQEFREMLVDSLEAGEADDALTAYFERGGIAAHLQGERDVQDEIAAAGGDPA